GFEAGLQLLAPDVARDPEDQVVRAEDLAVYPPQPLRREILRVQVRLLHDPPRGVVAVHETVKLPDRDRARLVPHPAHRIQLPEPPDLDALGIEPRPSHHLRPKLEGDVE